ncbi:MAG: site-2 protease family protein, partial [Clostridia bacterium]|nr:site-2 protease family protein [Clostridia bacterium]
MDILSGGLSFEALVPGILASLIVIFLTLPIHEFAHGFVANKLGDPTARYQGRLTLNPMAHIDYLGALCILLVGFGWAKPVPINSYYFKKPKRDIALTALAGPVSNLIMALVVTLLRNILIVLVGRRSVAMEYVLPTLVYISIINIS